MNRPLALVAEDDPRMLTSLQKILRQVPELTVVTATDGDAAWALAQESQPDLIISDYAMPGMNGFEFCQRVKDDPALHHTMFVVLTGYDDTAMKVKGLDLGVDDYLTKPVDVPEFLAKIRATLRIKRLQDRLQDDNVELERLRANLEQSFDRLLHVLTFTLDLKIPGATERGDRLAERSIELAQRMEVPEEFHADLVLAARLHEVGKLVDRESAHLPGDADEWDYLIGSKAILDTVDALRGAAELVIAIGERWDGSGGPKHLNHGQIPLRSRILRTLIDLFALCDEGKTAGDPAVAVQTLHQFVNTRYDPLVLSHVQEMLESQERGAWIQHKQRIPVTQLQDGMVLADDLFSGSGVKLLGGGARVTEQILESIIRRHAHDPILYGAWIKR